jgi:hypothetical protein
MTRSRCRADEFLNLVVDEKQTGILCCCSDDGCRDALET